MLITSHLLVTLLASKALSLGAPEIYAALAAGVAVDADHFFVNKKWISDIRDFVLERKITHGTNQHSWLQEVLFGTLAGIIIGVLVSMAWPSIRWWIIPLFLLMHIAMDAVMSFEHKPFAPLSKRTYRGWLRSGTKAELLISVIGLVWILL